MRNFSEKVAEQIKGHFMFNNVLSDNRTFYVITWKYMAEKDRSQMAI
jgi:hypothetical protein